MRKRARLLHALDYCQDYCITSLPPFVLPQCRFHYPCTLDDLAYVDDAESGSREHFSVAQSSLQRVLLGWRANVANVDLQPILARGVSDTSESTPGGWKPFLMDTTTHWTMFVYACLRTSRRKCGLALLRQDARRPGHPHTKGPLLPAQQPSRRRMMHAQRLQRGR